MARILMGLGSNLGDPAMHVRAGWQQFVAQTQLQAARLSRLVQSAPAEGVTGEPFVNAVGVGETTLKPLEILEILQTIERAHGRDRQREGPGRARTLDVDLLDWNGEILHLPQLELPHPRLHLRDFVLVPLAELVPDFVHPLLGQSVGEMLNSLDQHWNLPTCAS